MLDLIAKDAIEDDIVYSGTDPSTRTKATFDARSAIPVVDGTQIRLQSPGTNELDYVQSSVCMPSHNPTLLYRGQFMTSTHLHVNYVLNMRAHAYRDGNTGRFLYLKINALLAIGGLS